MVEGYPDMAGWGVPAISKEAGRLLYKYIRILHPFILAFLLPVAVIQFLELIGLSWLGSHEAPHSFRDRQHRHRRHFGFNALAASFKATDKLPPFIVQLMLVSIAIVIVVWLLVTLAIAAIAKAVQYIYSDREEDPCIVKSIFKALPAAFFRLFITSLWIFLVDLVASLVVSLPFIVLSAVFKDEINLESVHQAFLLVVLLVADFLFFFSQQVAVLEPENYGVAALKRSFKLIQAKLPTALTLFAIYVIFGFTLAELSQITTKFELPHWMSYILAVLIALFWLAFSVYWLLVITVFYFASKLKNGAEEQLLPDENLYRPLAVSAEN